MRQKILYLICVVWLTTLSHSLLLAQCTYAPYGQNPSTFSNTKCDGSVYQSIGQYLHRGEYSYIRIIPQHHYWFKSSIATDWLTITNSDGTIVYDEGRDSVYMLATESALVRFYTHTDSLCGNSPQYMQRLVKCWYPNPPANDFCEDAQLIIPDTACHPTPGVVFGAQQQYPGWLLCFWQTAIAQDVWYQFDADGIHDYWIDVFEKPEEGEYSMQQVHLELFSECKSSGMIDCGCEWNWQNGCQCGLNSPFTCDGLESMFGQRANVGVLPAGRYFYRVYGWPTTMGWFNTCVTYKTTLNPLPIQLSSFTAQCADSAVDLRWTTATEINNEKFIIEHSRDVQEWKTVAVIGGAGNSNQELSYSFVDKRPYSGISYYRLRQVDYDGTSETFNPVSVGCDAAVVNSVLHLYPNPNDGSFTVVVTVPAGFKSSVDILDYAGRIVSKSLVAGNGELTKIEFIQTVLSAGIYTVRVTTVDGMATSKMTIIK